MDRDEELELIREIVGLAERKSAYLDATVAHSPIRRYASAERFDQERATIFTRLPVVAARSGELDGPGAFMTEEIMGLPALLARDDEGTAHAFLNVCRHRGARLERATSGCKRVFTCPYHAWSWANTGELRGVPHEAQGFPDLPRAEHGLRRLPVAEAHGFIWIVANADAGVTPDIDSWLSGLERDFRWLGLSDHRIAAEETMEIGANWKVLMEGGLESYHFRVAHRDTIGPYFTDNLSSYRTFGPHLRSVLPRVSMTDMRPVPEENRSIRKDANLLYTVLPTMQLLVQQDHVMWFLFKPRATDRTSVRMATLVPRSSPDTDGMRARWEKNQHITRTALMEDFTLGEEIQSGFASRGNPSHLFGRFEGALNRFNLVIEDMISGRI